MNLGFYLVMRFLAQGGGDEQEEIAWGCSFWVLGLPRWVWGIGRKVMPSP